MDNEKKNNKQKLSQSPPAHLTAQNETDSEYQKVIGRIKPPKTVLTPRQKLVQVEILLAKNMREKNPHRKFSAIKVTELKQEMKLLRMQIKHQKQLQSLIARSNKNNIHGAYSSIWINVKRFNEKFEQYAKKQLWYDVGLVTIASLLMTLAFNYFIAVTGDDGIYPPGLGAIARQASLFIKNNKNNLATNETYYFALYFILNVPFFIFGLYKVGVKFTFLSALCIGFQNVFNFFLQIIPPLKPSHFWLFVNYRHISDLNDKNGDPIYLLWLFVFAVVAGLICGVGYAIVYRTGGSTAGTDFVSGFYQKKYNISIVSVSRIINIFLVVIVILIQTLIVTKDDLQHYFNAHDSIHTEQDLILYRLRYFLGPTLGSSLLFVIVESAIANWIYPKYRYVCIKIHSRKTNHIVEALKFRGYNYMISTTTKFQLVNTDKWVGIGQITFYVSMINLKEAKTIIRIIDKDAVIFINLIRNIQNLNVFKNDWVDRSYKEQHQQYTIKPDTQPRRRSQAWRKKSK